MNDEKIIALFFSRQEEAITRTDEAYGRRLLHLSDNLLNCPEDAQECVNDTYWKAWNTIPPTRPNNLFGYLARICRNCSLNRLDWANAAKRKAEVFSLTQEMEQCIPAPCRSASAHDETLGRQLNAFLRTLSPENRMVFIRRYWYAESTASIAARYGIREGTLLTRLHRIRKKLALYLQKEGISL